MRALHLTDSDATHVSDVPEAERSFRVAERMLAAASGEAVETINRSIWPSPQLPDIIDGWMERYRPDLVMFHVNGFWYLYPSVPLKLERTLGRFGRPLARAGFKAGSTRWIATTRAFHWARRLALRTVGGAYYFTPDEVIQNVEACVRRIVAHENIGLVLRGNLVGWPDGEQSREAAVHSALANLARELHVHFLARDWRTPTPARELYSSGDRMHSNSAVHAFYGEQEGNAFIEAWRSEHAAVGREGKR